MNENNKKKSQGASDQDIADIQKITVARVLKGVLDLYTKKQK